MHRGGSDGDSPTKKHSQNGEPEAHLERVASSLFARFQRQHRNLSDSIFPTTETLR